MLSRYFDSVSGDDRVRIISTAYRHGLNEAEIRHAVRHALVEVRVDDDVVMLIGPTPTAALVEVGIAAPFTDDERIIHAMPARKRYLRLLPPPEVRPP